jgi:hypothetical protein
MRKITLAFVLSIVCTSGLPANLWAAESEKIIKKVEQDLQKNMQNQFDVSKSATSYIR